MANKTKARRYALAASVLAFVSFCVYPVIFIKWIVPLYAVSVVVLIAAAFLFFAAYFTAAGSSKPYVCSAIGAVVYAALLMGITPLVNNLICGGVAPWGSTLVNLALHFAFWLIMLRLIRRKTGEALPVKPLLCALLIVIGLPVGVIEIAPNVKATGFIVWDTVKNYEKRIGSIDIYENTLDTAVPQTQVYDLIMEHLRSPLPEGKTEKKALVLGWDGCRADAMCLKEDRTAVDALLADGGKAFIAYCGGANYPAPITQETATRAGWTTMFTGRWADGHGITGFDDVSVPKLRTFFTTAIEDGLIDSSAFCYSWSGHNETYADEMEYDKTHSLNVAWDYSEGEEGGGGDDGTLQKALEHVQEPDCPDLIFTIFEYCDYYGHTYGFWNDNPEYAGAFKKSNETGLELINAVKARPSYESEDWLILITSDHGGYSRGHGGAKLMERMMFIITNR